MKKFIIILSQVLLTIVTSIYAEDIITEENVYSIEPYDYRRGNTDSKYRYDQRVRDELRSNPSNNELLKNYLSEEKVFLPTYEDLARKENDLEGIFISDWTMHMLSRTTFALLDLDKNDCITKDELNKRTPTKEQEYKDHFNVEYRLIGCLEAKVQTKEAAKNACKHIPDHVEKFKKLTLKDHEYYVGADYPNADEAPIKTYIKVHNGEVIKKQVSLKEYAMLLLNDASERDPMFTYLFGILLIGILAGGTILISKYLE